MKLEWAGPDRTVRWAQLFQLEPPVELGNADRFQIINNDRLGGFGIKWIWTLDFH